MGSYGLTDQVRSLGYARIYGAPDEVRRMLVARRMLRDPYHGTPWA